MLIKPSTHAIRHSHIPAKQSHAHAAASHFWHMHRAMRAHTTHMCVCYSSTCTLMFSTWPLPNTCAHLASVRARKHTSNDVVAVDVRVVDVVQRARIRIDLLALLGAMCAPAK